jgi:hypothetical protein
LLSFIVADSISNLFAPKANASGEVTEVFDIKFGSDVGSDYLSRNKTSNALCGKLLIHALFDSLKYHV